MFFETLAGEADYVAGHARPGRTTRRSTLDRGTRGWALSCLRALCVDAPSYVQELPGRAQRRRPKPLPLGADRERSSETAHSSRNAAWHNCPKRNLGMGEQPRRWLLLVCQRRGLVQGKDVRLMADDSGLALHEGIELDLRHLVGVAGGAGVAGWNCPMDDVRSMILLSYRPSPVACGERPAGALGGVSGYRRLGRRHPCGQRDLRNRIVSRCVMQSCAGFGWSRDPGIGTS